MKDKSTASAVLVVIFHGGIIRKELPQHSFTIVVNEASTPPTPPLAWPTEIPIPTSNHVSR